MRLRLRFRGDAAGSAPPPSRFPRPGGSLRPLSRSRRWWERRSFGQRPWGHRRAPQPGSPRPRSRRPPGRRAVPRQGLMQAAAGLRGGSAGFGRCRRAAPRGAGSLPAVPRGSALPAARPRSLRAPGARSAAAVVQPAHISLAQQRQRGARGRIALRPAPAPSARRRPPPGLGPASFLPSLSPTRCPPGGPPAPCRPQLRRGEGGRGGRGDSALRCWWGQFCWGG